jgi:hypothetical protein
VSKANGISDIYKRKRYQCVALSEVGFLQQLTGSYVGKGSVYFVPGEMPARKAAGALGELLHFDIKIIEKYGIDRSPVQRSRRKEKGLANVHYLREGKSFLLLATEGKHENFWDEERRFHDCRQYAIRVGPYDVTKGAERACVELREDLYNDLCGHFLERCTHWPHWRLKRRLGVEFWRHPAYLPIQHQWERLLTKINKKLKKARMPQIGESVIPRFRKQVRVFGERAEEKDQC